MFPATWRDIFAGMDRIGAARSIRSAGYLVSNGKDRRLTNRVSIRNQKESFYSVSAAIMGDDGEFTVHGDAHGVREPVRTEQAEPDPRPDPQSSQVHTVRSQSSEGADWEERAAVLEYEAGLSRDDAEFEALREVTQVDDET